jgi:hypothetical protein
MVKTLKRGRSQASGYHGIAADALIQYAKFIES